MVRMKAFGDRLPKSLSGGQQQRIALARALVIEPDLLLLDEPLSALDLKLREEMRDEIHRIVRELGITTVFVTHDQGEALVLSDLVAVMNAGRVEQLAPPRELYRTPASAFVADFIGGANVLRGRADGADRHRFLFDGGLELVFPSALPAGASALSIRPEDIALRPPGSPGIEATVTRSRFLGNAFEYTMALAGGRTLNVRTDGHSAYAEGERVALVIDTGRLTVLTESRPDCERAAGFMIADVFRADLFRGKVALITGAGRGIGAGIAKAFAALGARTIRHDIDAEALGGAMRDFPQDCVAGDLTEPGGAEAVFAEALGRAGRIDFLVNNAGRSWAAETREIEPGRTQELIELNLKSVLVLSRCHGAACPGTGRRRLDRADLIDRRHPRL